MSGSVSLIDGHIDEVCPCIGCEIRKVYAIRFDAHWHDGVDCPFECPAYNEWKKEDGQ